MANIMQDASLIKFSSPRWIFLQLLENCNLRCRMCYEWGDNGSYKNKARLKKLDITTILGIIDDFKVDRPYYELFGGEPLLYPQIGRVLSAIRDSGSLVHFPTNGTLLSQHAEMLVEMAPHRIWVSLDGPPSINDEQRGQEVFARAMAGIEAIHERRQRAGVRLPEIGISTVVTPRNQHAFAELFLNHVDLTKIDCVSIELQAYLRPSDHREYVSMLRESWGIDGAPIAGGFVSEPDAFAEIDAGVIARQVEAVVQVCSARGIYVNCYPKIMTEENIEAFFSGNWHSMKGTRKRCPFPWISTEVSARGDVTTCHAFYDLAMGNVNNESLREIWQGKSYSKFRSAARKGLMPNCQACCLFYNERPPY